jgi:hypothetical protein
VIYTVNTGEGARERRDRRQRLLKRKEEGTNLKGRQEMCDWRRGSGRGVRRKAGREVTWKVGGMEGRTG